MGLQMPHHLHRREGTGLQVPLNNKGNKQMFGINKTAISLALLAIITTGCADEDTEETTSATTSTSTVTTSSTYYTTETGAETGSTTGTETGATTGTSTGTTGTTTDTGGQ